VGAVNFTPGNDPFHNLAAALVPSWKTTPSETHRLSEIGKLGQALKEGTITLADAVTLTLQKSTDAERLLVIVDQFEELFTLTEEKERTPFVQTLLAAADAAPVTLLLTLRADFYGQACGLGRALSDLIQQGVVNIGPMTREELRQAIEQPAQSVGLAFEPGLVERLLDSIEAQPGNLPLLEFALTELWERRTGTVLTHQAFESIGRVEGALSRHAETQFTQLTAPQQKVALRVFSRLPRVSAANEEGTDTRQRLPMSELDAASQAVVQQFVKARLLTTSLNDATNEETVEVAHEALLRRWERLKQSLNADREFLLWRQRLGFVLNEWQRTDRDAGVLLRGAPLREALGWQKERAVELNETERAFLKDSEAASRRPKRWLAAVLGFVTLLTVSALAGCRKRMAQSLK
jgi:hypothetical protein